MNNYLSVIWWAIIWIAIGAYYLKKNRIDTHEWQEHKRQPYEPSYLRPRKIKRIVDADADDISRYKTILQDYTKETDTQEHQRLLTDYFK